MRDSVPGWASTVPRGIADFLLHGSSDRLRGEGGVHNEALAGLDMAARQAFLSPKESRRRPAAPTAARVELSGAPPAP